MDSNYITNNLIKNNLIKNNFNDIIYIIDFLFHLLIFFIRVISFIFHFIYALYN